MKNASFLLLTLGICLAYAADESMIQLKQGQGVQAARNNCATCDSLEYIEMKSPFLDTKGWQAEIGRMISVSHAPITKNDAATIADFLIHQYDAEPLIAERNSTH